MVGHSNVIEKDASTWKALLSPFWGIGEVSPLQIEKGSPAFSRELVVKRSQSPWMGFVPGNYASLNSLNEFLVSPLHPGAPPAEISLKRLISASAEEISLKAFWRGGTGFDDRHFGGTALPGASLKLHFLLHRSSQRTGPIASGWGWPMCHRFFKMRVMRSCVSIISHLWTFH